MTPAQSLALTLRLSALLVLGMALYIGGLPAVRLSMVGLSGQVGLIDVLVGSELLLLALLMWGCPMTLARWLLPADRNEAAPRWSRREVFRFGFFGLGVVVLVDSAVRLTGWVGFWVRQATAPERFQDVLASPGLGDYVLTALPVLIRLVLGITLVLMALRLAARCERFLCPPSSDPE